MEIVALEPNEFQKAPTEKETEFPHVRRRRRLQVSFAGRKSET
ncbi:MAG: hypothetical protein ROZ36_11995 [Thermincola sp.]|nr:hypothetical protein [Thermincola sp.]